MKEVVFVHRVPIGEKSPQRARQALAEYMETCSIELETAIVKNIIVPTKTAEASVEKIYESVDFEPTGLGFGKKREKTKSDILIEHFISKVNYDAYIAKQELNKELEADLNRMKEEITDQISHDEYEQAFGRVSWEQGEPVGIVGPGRRTPAIILYLNMNTQQVFCKSITMSEYYKYLSLCHSKREMGLS